MYRPTVRYDESFREYVDSLFHATTLDRNQIIRLGLFLLGHTKEGKDVLTHFATSPLPAPNFTIDSHGLWYGKPLQLDLFKQEGGGTSHDNEKGVHGHEGQTSRQEREVSQQTAGHITVRIGNTILLPKRG